jgi:hypothetical protein
VGWGAAPFLPGAISKLTMQSKVTSLAGEAVAGGLLWLPFMRVGAQDEDLQPSAAKTNLGA